MSTDDTLDPATAVQPDDTDSGTVDTDSRPSENRPATAQSAASTLDLDAVEGDLADVEVALARLEAGTYFTDEQTGAPLSDDLLTAHPTARRA